MSRSPSLFISHGSPMFALEPGVLGPRLAQLGAALDGISAILVVSPHWQPSGLRVTGADRLTTIHDFGGFPQPLYELLYEPSGAPVLAQQVVDLFAQAGLAATLDVPASTLSFHLKGLTSSGLVSQERDGRNLIYRPDINQMNALIGYLSAHCCHGEDCGLVPSKGCQRC